MKFHHIGVACADISKVRQWVKQTHDIVGEQGPLSDPLQNVTLVLLHTAQGLAIELISGPQVDNFVKRGMTCYHICYAVKDLDEVIKGFLTQGAVMLSAPKPTVLFEGKRVAFLQTPMGIIELLEE